MATYILTALFVVTWIAALGVWVLAAVSMFGLMKGRRRERGWGSLLGPFMLFFPGLFTEEGNRHRVRLVWSVAAFLGLLLLGVCALAFRDYFECGHINCA